MLKFVLVYTTFAAPLVEITATGAHVDAHMPGLQTMFVSCPAETALQLAAIDGVELVRPRTQRHLSA